MVSYARCHPARGSKRLILNQISRNKWENVAISMFYTIQ
jgi:hypothetical protein